jgi:hypothetical protein
MRGFRSEDTMEAERINQLAATIDDLSARLSGLRRYL